MLLRSLLNLVLCCVLSIGEKDEELNQRGE